ncbi:MAG TPA: DNA translocase FtsK [Pyrinomonadaceae bacterium]|nr:DNA translocase FtsK [Pyrinomonadaceae bacterium]
MATTQTEARARTNAAGARRSRRNEITAIALFALSALLLLCLVSYDWTDPSRHTATPADGAHNWAGRVGSYVAAELLQSTGLAAYLLPLLLFAVAWRRFRTRHIHAPLSRVVGLVVLLFAAAGLLDLLGVPVPFDANFLSGGFVGALVAGTLRGALNTVGAGVLLVAAGAVGLLLATNFSFVSAYERVAAAFGDPSGHLHALRERYNAWRVKRREAAEARAAGRQAAREAREQARAEELANANAPEPDDAPAILSGREAQRGAAAIRRSAAAAPEEVSEVDEEIMRKAAQLAQAEAELASILNPPAVEPQPARKKTAVAAEENGAAPKKRVTKTAPVEEVEEISGEAEEVEEMVRGASVVRAETEEDAPALYDDEEVRPPRARGKKETPTVPYDFALPPFDFLNSAPPRHEQAEETLRGLASLVAEKCREFNVTGKIEYICPGPVVTTYEFKPDPGVKYARVTGLVDDLCLALRAESVRIDRVPGKAHVGIEVPNPERETIFVREVLESRPFRESQSKLTLALGKTIDGLNYVADLARMPHLLIAGATGTGKSVCLNSIVVSILYKARPDEVNFIMIDPKRLELGLYADIPHLATPIITEPKKAANALKWAVRKMEERYKQLAQVGVRNIDGYNAEVERRNNVLDFDDDGNPHKPLPYIVIIIDELADLMMTSGHEVEEAITRLAQMARAVGIHLVLATQRPSVDVITGLIKANFPSRIAFRVSSKVDSRTNIDSNGAEQLLGRGDMLFLPPGTSRLIRVHGAYLDESEVARVVAHVKQQGQPVYDETITLSEDEAAGGEGSAGERDELFEDALRICVEMKRASTSVLQRRLRIGYGRAAAILDAMEREGFIGQADGARPRPVLGRAFETVSHWDDLKANDPEAG